jgi:hypothetical protein
MIITILSHVGASRLNQVGVSRGAGLASQLAMLRTNAGRNVLLIYPKSLTPSRVSDGAWEAIETKLGAVAYAVLDECLQSEIQSMSPFYNDIVIEEETRAIPGNKSTLTIADTAIVQIQPGCFGPEIRSKLMKRIVAAQMINPAIQIFAAVIGSSDGLSYSDLQSAQDFVAGIRSAVLVKTSTDNRYAALRMSGEVTHKLPRSELGNAGVYGLYRSIFASDQAGLCEQNRNR